MKAENKKFINERFLTRRGLEAKLLSQKKELTTEALKAKRLARNEDMIELVEKDSMDMKEILNGISADKVPSTMKLLWETQIKQLSAKSSNGYRWNPRFVNS
jgi:predicted secreted protein